MMTAPTTPIRTAEDLRGRRVVVLGLARSGVAATRFLADAGAVVAAYDRRPASELAEAIAALGARPVRLALGIDEVDATALLEHADLLVTSPSVSSRFPTTDPWLREALGAAEARGAQVLSEVDLFMRLTGARLVGVTGTKGKTTTASLLAAMLAEGGLPTVLGGNIGTPLVERSLELGPDDWVVLELSELQLPTISRGVDVALYTNIAEDHLDRHGTVEAYRAVKALLAELTVPDGRVVLNHDDPGSRELGERLPPAALAWYGMDRPGRGEPEAWLEDGWLIVGGERVGLRRGGAPARSPHARRRARGRARGASDRGRRQRDRNRGTHVRRGPASARDGRRAERRALDQRLAGHDSAGGDRGPRGLRLTDRADRRRQGQGPRLRRIRRRDRVARPRASC